VSVGRRGQAKVTRGLTLHVIGPDDIGLPVRVLLCYDAVDPYAVEAIFQDSRGEDLIWIFARELIKLGMGAATGEGDVRVWPARGAGHEVVCIGLKSPDGQAVLRAQAHDVFGFLASTYALCPEGSESDHLDIEGGLSDLLKA
jgi:hypothetical protein